MKKILLIIPVLAVLFSSCQKEHRDHTPQPAGEQEVEIILSTGRQATRATNAGTPEERIVEELDLLVFDGGGFKLWRSAYRVDSRFRATLPVGTGLDVYFVANCRGIISALDAADELATGLTWEQVRLKLVDNNPGRLVVASGFENLPMWGQLLNQTVEDVPVNKWGTVSLIRSVASVDVYVDPGVNNFTLQDLRLYFVPDKGFLAPRAGNYDASGLQVIDAEAPADMTTTLSPILYTDRYDVATLSIANKLYLYDNDTHSGNRTLLPDTSHRHTRLVVGGEYEGGTYYYPVDFATQYDSLDMVKRNWKYVFTVNSVSSRGYENPETASTEPMIGIDLNIVNWNEDSESDFWVSGPYYLGLDKRAVTLGRAAGSTDAITARSNILSDNITLEFKTAANGLTTGTGTANAGIANSRFRVEKIKDPNGYITSLAVTALGAYDPVTASRNSDAVVLTSGRIQVEITVTQIDGSDTDWNDGGDIGGGTLGR